jgi:hypothetical protein
VAPAALREMDVDGFSHSSMPTSSRRGANLPSCAATWQGGLEGARIGPLLGRQQPVKGLELSASALRML